MRKTTAPVWLILALTATAAACGDSSEGGTAGDADATEVGGGDVSLDFHGDVPSDTGDDLDAADAPDVAIDVPDADAPGDEPDGGADAPSRDADDVSDDAADADPDVSDAADTSDTSDDDVGEPIWTGLPPLSWDFCPGAEIYQGDGSWTRELVVTDEAVYCKMFDDVEWECCEGPIVPIIPFTQPQRWNNRFEMRVVAGTYAVPEAAKEDAIRLPICVQFADGRQGITSLDVLGTVTGGFSGESPRLTVDQPLLVGDEGWTANLFLTDEDDPPFQLDGSQSFFGGWTLGADEGPFPYGAQSCTHESAFRNWRFTITHERGDVALSTRIGDSPASTEPGVFYRAEGTFDGVAFSQTDRWHLWYEVQHHHFVQYYLVLFDENIGDVCGLQAWEVTPYSEEIPEALQIFPIPCEGIDAPTFPIGDAITITDFTFEQLD